MGKSRWWLPFISFCCYTMFPTNRRGSQSLFCCTIKFKNKIILSLNTLGITVQALTFQSRSLHSNYEKCWESKMFIWIKRIFLYIRTCQSYIISAKDKRWSYLKRSLPNKPYSWVSKMNMSCLLVNILHYQFFGFQYHRSNNRYCWLGC